MGSHSFNKEKYKNWILEQKLPDFEIIDNSENQILLKNDLGVAEIVFYGDDLAEISIVSRKDNQLKYYLHFELSEEEHVKELFWEMAAALQKLTEEKTIKVLLSCTSGATTTFFAEKLNENAKTLGLDYHFDAVPYLTLFETAPDYDVILIAPQIGYLYKKLKSAIPDKLVLQFPTSAFAGFNSMEALEFVRQQVKTYREDNALPKPVVSPSNLAIASDSTILTVGVVVEYQGSNVWYRLYHQGKVVLNEFVKVPQVNYQLLRDIIKRAKLSVDHIDLLGLAVPGIVSADQDNFALPHSNETTEKVKLLQSIKEEFGLDILISNNSNAAVLGLSALHPESRNLLYFSLPFGISTGGIGSIVNGQLVYGREGIAGEVFLYANRMQYSNMPSRLAKTDHGQLEIITNSILPAISILGPEILFLRTPAANDMNELHKYMLNYIPEQYIPKLEYVEDVSGYLMDGQLAICLEYLKHHSKSD
ncbi:MAG: ROK family protein [Ileibacterium sp.]|nr:ROK family protein [Ileibacterium sp.]